jgi:hypothetical protein
MSTLRSRIVLCAAGTLSIGIGLTLITSTLAIAEEDPPPKPGCCCVPPDEVAPSNSACPTSPCVDNAQGPPACVSQQDGTIINAKCNVAVQGWLCARTYANVTPKKWNCAQEACTITNPDGSTTAGTKCKWNKSQTDGTPILKLTCPDPLQECTSSYTTYCPGS